MFYHVVLLNLKGLDPTALASLHGFASRMRDELPFLREFHFGVNKATRAAQYGWTVVATFDDEKDHERYQVSDVHLQMKAFLTPFIEDIVVADVETAM
jgi:hypothetical protein